MLINRKIFFKKRDLFSLFQLEKNTIIILDIFKQMVFIF